jgi:hypothetical protein
MALKRSGWAGQLVPNNGNGEPSICSSCKHQPTIHFHGQQLLQPTQSTRSSNSEYLLRFIQLTDACDGTAILFLSAFAAVRSTYVFAWPVLTSIIEPITVNHSSQAQPQSNSRPIATQFQGFQSVAPVTPFTQPSQPCTPSQLQHRPQLQQNQHSNSLAGPSTSATSSSPSSSRPPAPVRRIQPSLSQSGVRMKLSYRRRSRPTSDLSNPTPVSRISRRYAPQESHERDSRFR